MKVLGVDPSTKTGLVWIDDPKIAMVVLNHPDKRGLHRLEALDIEFRGFLHQWQPDLVVIEGYGYANKYTLALMVEIGILFRMALHRAGIPFYTCPPSVLKKFATGKGNAKKSEVAKAVEGKWGFFSPSDDLVDAYVLAKIAQELSVSGLSTALKGVERG